jgi:hypothetical protein
MVEKRRSSEWLLVVPLHGRLRRPGGLPVVGDVAGKLGVGKVCTEKLDDGDLPATSWERNRVGLDEEKVQRWDKGRARAEKGDGLVDDQRQPAGQAPARLVLSPGKKRTGTRPEVAEG